MLGYFVEVTPTHEEAITDHDDFIHRQTLASARRFTTVALAELEEKLATASDKALARELEIFEVLSKNVNARGEAIARTASALAEIDVTAALAELAVRRRYVRPAVDDSLDFSVAGARHRWSRRFSNATPRPPSSLTIAIWGRSGACGS